MKKILLILILFLEFLCVSNIHAGYVYGWIWRRYIGGIPPHYEYTKDWSDASVRWIKLVRPDGSVAGNITNWHSHYYCTQYFLGECVGTYYQFYFWNSENITGWKLYIYAFRNNVQYIQTVVVPNNGAVLDFIVMDNATSETQNGPSLNINMHYPQYPNPFGCGLLNQFTINWPNSQNYRTRLEQSTDNVNWVLLADLGAGISNYDISLPTNIKYYYRAKIYFVYPVNQFTIESPFGSVRSLTANPCSSIEGPSSLRANRSGTFYANPYADNCVYEWKIKYDGGTWSNVISNNHWVDVTMGSTNFTLQTKVTLMNGSYVVQSETSTKYVTCSSCTPVQDNIASVLPNKYDLLQNYPNPFNPSTNIQYWLKNDVQVKLIIYDILGNEVIELVNRFENAGYKEIQWDGQDKYGNKVSSGIYIYKIIAGDFDKSMKMLLLK